MVKLGIIDESHYRSLYHCEVPNVVEFDGLLVVFSTNKSTFALPILGYSSLAQLVRVPHMLD